MYHMCVCVVVAAVSVVPSLLLCFAAPVVLLEPWLQPCVVLLVSVRAKPLWLIVTWAGEKALCEHTSMS